MALTRKLLKGMGLTDEQVDTIIEAHADTVDGLKAERDKFKTDAEKLPAVEKELGDMKAKGDDGWKDKHDAVKKEYEDFKAGIEAEKSKAAKESAARAFFDGKGIKGKSLDLAVRASAAEIAALKLKDGKIEDETALNALITGELAALVGKTDVRGPVPATPPAGGGAGAGKTKEEILSIKDGAARRKAMAENPELFGLAPNKSE